MVHCHTAAISTLSARSWKTPQVSDSPVSRKVPFSFLPLASLASRLHGHLHLFPLHPACLVVTLTRRNGSYRQTEHSKMMLILSIGISEGIVQSRTCQVDVGSSGDQFKAKPAKTQNSIQYFSASAKEKNKDSALRKATKGINFVMCHTDTRCQCYIMHR